MTVLVVGGGGREHAVIKKLKESPRVGRIFAAPGNGGISRDAECVPIKAGDVPALVAFAKEAGVDFAVIAPEDPLVHGAVDAFSAAGIRAFGPTADAAILEGSKIFAKNFMKRHGIPTAPFSEFDDLGKALRYLESAEYPVVVKADGLAAGKGVIIAADRAEAEAAVRSMMEDGAFGESGKRLEIEKFLTGPEVSVLAFCDGEHVFPMASSMDHKRAYDGDRGPNTGGMGTVAPNPFYTDEVARQAKERIFIPTVRGMREEGRPFRGCLYFGLMITDDGPYVIEYNCRFGDPETQVVLPLLDSDLLDVMEKTVDGTLTADDVRIRDGHACCVIMAHEGYPGKYEGGFEIVIPREIENDVYVAGGTVSDGKLISGGGRVLGVSATAPTLEEAVGLAYRRVGMISFPGSFYRRDIGKRALSAYNG
ncbi:MAG: phosphoribosylamine--glycine ligase [Clostridia bacterium]|nr:phosphoribosylamine--glycine ligase [Clostridia bacterium]